MLYINSNYLLILMVYFAFIFPSDTQNYSQIGKKVDSFKNNVVKIESYDSKGTGLIIGVNGNECYILTAMHNLKEGGQYLEIKLFGERNFYKCNDFKSKKFDDLDVVIINAKLPTALIRDFNLKRINIASKSSLKSGIEIMVIGHTTKKDWDISKNIIGDTAYQGFTHIFSISQRDLTLGCSGGPVFDNFGDLLGMVIEQIENGFLVVNIYDIVRKSSNFTIYFNLLNFSPDTNMVFIHGGNYKKNGKKDTVIAPFLLDRYEVTNKEFAKFLNEFGDNKDKDGHSLFLEYKSRLTKEGGSWKVKKGYEEYPVVFVSWFGANEYAKWKNKRLPTEAEWEYAAKGGISLCCYATLSGNLSIEFANYKDSKEYRPVEVGSYAQNRFGLFDMTGNVWEWCQDRYKDNLFVIKGGSWTSDSIKLNINYRKLCNGSVGDKDVGFRCAKDF